LNDHQQKELGRTLRFVRHIRQFTLRDVAKRAGRSYQYVQNIETGARGTVAVDGPAFAEWIATGYGLPLPMVRSLVLRAEVLSALEQFGLAEGEAGFVWAGIENRLREIGKEIPAGPADIAEEVMRA
jgi:transcriptional regulator with XRE-family HTH domain